MAQTRSETNPYFLTVAFLSFVLVLIGVMLIVDPYVTWYTTFLNYQFDTHVDNPRLSALILFATNLAVIGLGTLPWLVLFWYSGREKPSWIVKVCIWLPGIPGASVAIVATLTMFVASLPLLITVW